MINTNYEYLNTNYLSDGNSITKYCHQATRDTVSLAKISGENTLVELFKYHVLLECETNQKNVFVYAPSLRSQEALVIEFGIQSNKDGFSEKPKRSFVCIGSEIGIASLNPIVFRESNFYQTKKMETISAEENSAMISDEERVEKLQILQATKFEELSTDVQERLYQLLPTLPDSIQEHLVNESLLHTAQTLIRSQQQNCASSTSPTTKDFLSYAEADFVNKTVLDQFHRQHLEAGANADIFSYTRIIQIAPKDEEHVLISSENLKAIKEDLDAQLGLLVSNCIN